MGRRKHPRGVRRWKGGWQAYIRVNRTLHSKDYPLDTPLDVMQEWREKTRKKYRGRSDKAGSFGADITDYLSRVAAMKTIKQRTHHLNIWADALGRDRRRDSIESAEIDRIIQEWQLPNDHPLPNGRKPPKGEYLTRGVGAATVRKRRTALLHMFNKLDGKGEANVVRGSTPPSPPKEEVRELAMAIAERGVDAMPESRTKRRVAVMLKTGLPPSLLSKVRRHHIDFAARELVVHPRRKGKGVEGTTVPLLPQAVPVLQAFDRHNDYGPFAKNWYVCAARSFKNGLKRAGIDITGKRFYDARHGFGAHIYRVTRDLPTVKRLLVHSNLRTTERYAMGAVREVDRDAVERAGEALAQLMTPQPKPKPVKKPGRKLSRKVVPLRKARRGN